MAVTIWSSTDRNWRNTCTSVNPLLRDREKELEKIHLYITHANVQSSSQIHGEQTCISSEITSKITTGKH